MNEIFLEIKNKGVNMYRVVLTGAAQRWRSKTYDEVEGLRRLYQLADHRNVPTAPIKMIYLGDTDGTGGRVAMNEFFWK